MAFFKVHHFSCFSCRILSQLCKILFSWFSCWPFFGILFSWFSCWILWKSLVKILVFEDKLARLTVILICETSATRIGRRQCCLGFHVGHLSEFFQADLGISTLKWEEHESRTDEILENKANKLSREMTWSQVSKIRLACSESIFFDT